MGDRALPYVEAHRGYSGRYPENTHLAFDKAIEAGADQIELDVRLSQDGQLLVIHDATLDRTTTGTGYVHERESDYISSLSAGAWGPHHYPEQKIPTFDEVVRDYAHEVELNVEIKTSETPESHWRRAAEEALRVVAKHGALSRVIFSSFSLDALRVVRSLSDEARLALLDWELANLPALLELRGEAWLIRSEVVTPELVAHARAKGLRIFTGGSPATVARMIACGVDVLATDFPADLAAELRRWDTQRIAKSSIGKEESAC